MRYLTDRKRALGKGSAHSGTEHHWFMTVSAVGLAVMVPLFLYIFGNALGGTREEVLATFSRPVPAVLTAMLIVLGMRHFAKGCTIMIEDYTRGLTRKAAVIGVTLVSYAIMATGLYALARIAL